jgi:hypothetical protein
MNAVPSGDRAREFTLAALVVAVVLAGPSVWAQPADPTPEVHHIHGLAVDRRDPELLYVATHTGLVRLRPGKTPEWVGTHRFDLMGFTANPRETGVVYASGHPDLVSYRKEGVGNLGLLLSRDGGQTWQSVSLRGEADFHALTWSPRDGGQLYGWSVAGQAGLYRISTGDWSRERLPGRGLSNVLALAASPDPAGPLLAGTRTGLFMSRDGGVGWAPVTALPTDVAVTAVTYHSLDAKIVYAYLARSGLGLMRSRDGGGTWAPTGLLVDPQTPVVALAVGPGEQVVVATTSADILRSRDGGRTWQTVLQRGRPPGPPR